MPACGEHPSDDSFSSEGFKIFSDEVSPCWFFSAFESWKVFARYFIYLPFPWPESL